MATTIIYSDAVTTPTSARPAGDDLWLTLADLTTTTGWEMKPEGVCRDDICIALPDATASALLTGDGPAAQFNLAGFARFTGQPYAYDHALDVWYFGAGADERGSQLLSLEAPDFELPDLGGKTHRLSDFRGRKVFLALWASW